VRGVGAIVVLLAATTAAALWLFPHDSDAAFVAHDALYYGMQAERTPARSLNPSHPGFHALVLALVGPLRGLGVAHPGHVACRIVAGLGAAWLLLQIAALAGPSRLLAGAGFALVIAASRGFVIETALGENVIPAAAAALFALTVAARPRVNLVLAAGALTLALLLRQDNVLLVPGVAAAVAIGSEPGTRFARVAKLLAAAGVATIAGYLAAWWVAMNGNAPFFDWLLGIGREGPRSAPELVAGTRAATYVATVASAMTGDLAPPRVSGVAIGLGYLVAIVVAGLLMKGRAPRRILAVPFVVTLVARASFHAWFEPHNFEWLILPIALGAAFASGLVHGAPATPPAMRRTGAAILVLLTAWFLAAHGASTWRLRDRSFIRSMEAAVNVDRKEWRFLAASLNAHTALDLLEVPHDAIRESPRSLEDVARALRANPVPTTVLWDRGLGDGMPNTLRQAGEIVSEIDTMPMPPTWERLMVGKQVYGIRWRP
jgi:hypothetical protein